MEAKVGDPVTDLALEAPRLVTPLPGPRARDLIERDRLVVSPSYTRGYPLVMAQGRGAVVEDVDGNRFLDFSAGIAVTATGHSHPDVVRAIAEQAARFIHMSGTDFYYGPQVTLAEKLAEIAPIRGPVRCFFGNSGAEAVEAAVKLSRHHTKRPYLIAFYGGFHGRTMGALALTASKAIQRQGFAPHMPGVYHAPYPDPYRTSAATPEACAAECVEFIEEVLFHQVVAPAEVAAFVLEPIQGEGGYIVPPRAFFERLTGVAKRHGILLVADEVQSGMGRTGRMFAAEQFGFEPDIVTVAKGIASGLPLGVAIARREIMDWPAGSHASTFGGNPVACAAAIETIRLVREQYMANAEHQGAYLLEQLRGLAARHRLIGDVRGMGLMIGVELVRDRTTKARADRERDAVVQAAFRRGLLLLGAGRNAIRFTPPLVIDREQASRAVAIFDDALADVEAG